MQLTSIQTDDSLMELVRHGTADFPFQYYHENIRLFDVGLVDWHWHREIELVTVERGDVACLIGDMRIPLRQGEGIFINSGVIHRFEAQTEGVIPNILFAAEFLSPLGSLIHEQYIAPILASGISHMPFAADVPWQREVLQKLEIIYDCCERKIEAWELQVHALLSQIWTALFLHRTECGRMETAGLSLLSQARIKRMVRFIEQSYPQRIALDDIARAADISKSEALRCFRACLHTSPVAHLNSVRLLKARELLLHTHRSVTEIAQAVGFESASYFNRLFKRAYAATPKTVRMSSK